MGSLNNGQPITQSSEVVRNLGNGYIELSNVQSDSLVHRTFDFTKIPTFLLWLDAGDLTTITKDVDNKVSAWNDKSPNEFGAFEQSSDSNKPVWRPAIIGGADIPGIQNSRGSNNYLYIDEALFTSYPATIFIVGTCHDASVNNAAFWIGDKDSNGQDRISIRYAGGAGMGDSLNILTTHGGTSKSMSTVGIDTYSNFETLILTARLDSDYRDISKNGGQIATATDEHIIQNFDRTVIGREVDTTPADALSGYTHEVLVFNSLLSDFAIKNIQMYLARKWGVALNG